ncbi:CBM35 domain-containing protein [Streptomyces kanamyceticus]|uniref:Carbohydrate-binding protein n=1 Tax=Streptomyces kanamyceticus TaxID=1967 RepID=A0A5J6GD96_STRKN|nr:CBM35 domain-containing protein [Streptomyces kanamyceticus]QEU93539.1 carbohydrate-binding protein [Streptomyces kanamyceticus]
MTPGNNGGNTPSAPQGDDDPFGYLYEDGQAAGATPPSGGGGYGYPGPRSSYNHVRAVGDRRPAYGQTQPTQQYGQQVPPQQGAYGQPNAHYTAPEAQPGGAPVGSPQYAPAGGGRGRGPNSKGLLIAAVAVVVVVALGIGAAMLFGGDGDEDKSEGAGSKPSQAQSVEPSEKPSKGPEPVDLPKTDAKALKLEGGTSTSSDVKGAKSTGGIYVQGFNQVGAKVSWTVSVKKAGSYRLYVRYGIPGEDADATLNVNGKPNNQPLGMKNFIPSPKGDWEKGWQTTWAPADLNAGTNVIELECAEGNKCNANIDQLALKK